MIKQCFVELSCGNWDQCLFKQPIANTDVLHPHQTLTVKVVGSPYITSGCLDYHPYAFNAKSTLHCSPPNISTTSPTQQATTPSPFTPHLGSTCHSVNYVW
eukprot:294097_1